MVDLHKIYADVASNYPSLIYLVSASFITMGAVILGFVYILWRQRRELNMRMARAQEEASGNASHLKPDVCKDDSEEPENENEILTAKWPTDDKQEAQDNLINPSELKPLSNKNDDLDPLKFCGHIQGEVKRTKQRLATKKIEEEMTEDQKENERQAQRDQLAAIFKMMSEQNEKFGICSMEEMQEQMKLYSV